LQNDRVLVVEDDPAICRLIGDYLDGTAWTTVCVQSDRAAYAAIPTLPTIRAIILDINLGKGTTGFDIARFARQVMPEIAVVYVTGEVSQDSFRAFGVPDSRFLQKPFSPDDLLDVLGGRLCA
jgi:CheY-like chemotaxis protein